MAKFDISYNKTIEYEGGYANISGDKGGETYRGIARNFHPKWKGWKIIDGIKVSRSIKWNEIIDNPELEYLVKEFYIHTFWNIIKGEYINNQSIANFIFDYSIHSGIHRAISKLQLALGVTQDGIIGPNTLSSLNSNNITNLLSILKKERINFLIALSKKPGQDKFKKGWLDRVNSF